MADLSSIGYKKDDQNGGVNPKSLDEQLESMIGKTGADLLRNAESQSSLGFDNCLKTPEVPYIQPNPIDKTNEKISDLHSTIKSESSKSSISSNKWNRTMFIISIFALIISVIALMVSALFSILAFNSSNESSSRLEALITQVSELK